MAILTEINTGKSIEDYLNKQNNNEKLTYGRCIHATSTLTKGCIYKVIFKKQIYHPSINHRDGILIDKCAVINDRGLYVEVKANRFKIS
jgi:hypothetical protein